MSIQTTGLMKQQLMRQPADTIAETAMDGGVTRTSMAGDLVKAMNDIDFNQLIKQYSAISGQTSAKPLTNQFMKDNNLGGDIMFGEPKTPVLNPNEMPNLTDTYSNMPVIPDNFNNAPGIKDEERENMGLMKPQPMGA
tara:strand:- start:1128 stop:1541 length:414 start_codon:yes stop_codon:yes gene_type:complete